MLFMIDNYDSFTFNLVQYFMELGTEVVVYRNDAITVKEIEKLRPERLVISPGPCDPKKAGISVEAIKHFAGRLPILGVCLGHQSIGYAFGAEVVRAARLMHGKTSMVYHDNRTIFEGIENPFEANRYHSLIVRKETLPDCLEVSAWTDADEIMGLRHKSYQIEGVQFHPESILTRAGKDILKNFLKIQGAAHG
ncbi:MAG: aminodeoxychorismate/anthranilate synthase component II [Deltaproteobacteria bacterium]|nr:aminodeoxychorismate/anthranilate synthase component II [Deltaproteobacteria bacterium]